MGRAVGIAVIVVVVLAIIATERSEPSGHGASKGNSSDGSALSSRSAMVTNPAHDLLVRMGVAERSIMFARYMASGGERCGRVTRNFYQGSTPEGQAIWNIRCTATGDWSVMIEPNETGSTTLTECGALGLVGVRCWQRFRS